MLREPSIIIRFLIRKCGNNSCFKNYIIVKGVIQIKLKLVRNQNQANLFAWLTIFYTASSSS